MGAIFNSWHMNLVSELNDVKPNGDSILLATDDGKLRTSQQRSSALNDARRWIIHEALRRLGLSQTQILFKGNIIENNINVIGNIGILPSNCMFVIGLLNNNNTKVHIKRLASLEYDKDFDQDVRDGAEYEPFGILQGNMIKGIINLSDGTYQIKYFGVEELFATEPPSGNDPIEDIMWQGAILRYALYLCWLRSGNTDRANIVLNEAYALLSERIKK